MEIFGKQMKKRGRPKKYVDGKRPVRPERKAIMVTPQVSEVLDQLQEKFPFDKTMIVSQLVNWVAKQQHAVQLWAFGLLISPNVKLFGALAKAQEAFDAESATLDEEEKAKGKQ